MALCYYVIDVETNGLKCGWHEITEISVIRCADRNQLTKFIRIEHPERTSQEALSVTGRTKEDLRNGINAQNVVMVVHNFLLEDNMTNEHRCMIAHNASFDRRFCYELWGKYNLCFPAVCWLDTKSLTKGYANNVLGIVKPKLTLQASLDILGLKKRGTAHTATSDTQNTYILHDHLVKYWLDCHERPPRRRS